MKPKRTHIGVLLDRSGSMASIRDDMIGGFNTFLDEQRGVEGEATVSLARFDDIYEDVYSGVPIADAPLLNHENFKPRGNTAMRDALGRFIVKTGAFLSAIPEPDRPELVVIYVITDGFDNVLDQEYSSARLREMVKHQEEVYKWQFQYLGANQNAVLGGKSIGLAAAASVNYLANQRSVQSAYRVVGATLRSARLGVRASINLSEMEKSAIVADGERKPELSGTLTEGVKSRSQA